MDDLVRPNWQKDEPLGAYLDRDKLPPEVNLLGVAHYLEALDWQREVIKPHAIIGGKNPHPNWLVGGMAAPVNPSDTATLNAEEFSKISAAER
jgi:hydrogenase large subunit